MKNVLTYPKERFSCLIGVDEAGRGPLAGPLSVCAVLIKNKKSLRVFARIKDSKKLSEKNREMWFEKIREAESRGLIAYKVALIHNNEIDRKGIAACLKDGVSRTLRQFASMAPHTLVLLDGTLYAPKDFPHQVTICKGDERERVIAMASIAAKITRDRLMRTLSKKYPHYGFEKHKGYGTKAHYAAIRSCGVSPIHRTSFLKDLDKVPLLKKSSRRGGVSH